MFMLIYGQRDVKVLNLHVFSLRNLRCKYGRPELEHDDHVSKDVTASGDEIGLGHGEQVEGGEEGCPLHPLSCCPEVPSEREQFFLIQMAHSVG